MKKFKWYTNGKVNIKVYADTILEANFKPGFTVSKSYKKHTKNESLLKKMTKDYKLNSLQNRIDHLCRTKSYDEVFSLVKFNNFLDTYLKDLVLERCLIYQLSTLPKFFSTIMSQLTDLYDRNKALRNRSSVKDYFSIVLNRTSQ